MTLKEKQLQQNWAKLERIKAIVDAALADRAGADPEKVLDRITYITLEAVDTNRRRVR